MLDPKNKLGEREQYYKNILQSKPSIIWKNFTDGHNLCVRLFFPEGHHEENDIPSLAFFHAGMWITDNSLHLIAWALHLNSIGIAVLIPEYRTHQCYDITAADILQDAQDFWIWISRNASPLGLDPSNITLAGVEVGGLMALHAAMPRLEKKKKWLPWLWRKPSIMINQPAALAIFRSVIDLEMPEAQMLNIKEEISDYADINPIRRLSKDMPPIFIAHGDLDPLQDCETSDWFGHEWHHLGNPTSVFIAPRVDHTLMDFQINPLIFEQMIISWQSFMAEQGLWPEVTEDARGIIY